MWDSFNTDHKNYKIDPKKLFIFLKKRFEPEKIVYCGALFVGDFYREHSFIKDDYLNIKEIKEFFKDSKEEHKKIKFKNKNNTTNAIYNFLDRRMDDIKKISNQIEFVDGLYNIGFEMKIKPLKIMSSGKKKADCDVNITVEGMKDYENYDKIILFSGDGDFLPFLRFLKDTKKEIEVFSFGKSTAREIKSFTGGNWHDIGTKDFRNELEKDNVH